MLLALQSFFLPSHSSGAPGNTEESPSSQSSSVSERLGGATGGTVHVPVITCGLPLLNEPWPFEHASVFQDRAASHDSLVAQVRRLMP
jgi:hypothetical protein